MKRVVFQVCVVLLCGAALRAAPLETYEMTLGCKPDRRLEFKVLLKGEPLVLDLFLPPGYRSSEQRPCLVFFFGGGWKMGATDQFYAFGRYFSSRGLVAVSAQYRTQNSHGTTPIQCVEDSKEAVRYVRLHAKELGVDPNRIVVSGGSAGGHVAAACAMCPAIDATPESPISCVPNALVLFNPVYDNGPSGYGYDRVRAYWRKISPLHNIKPGLPPTVVFFGTDDRHVPLATIQAFQQRMVEAGNVCETHLYPAEKHGFFHVSKGGRALFEDVLVTVDAFFVENGFLSGENHVVEWTAKTVGRLLTEP